VPENPSIQNFTVPPEASGQRLDQWLTSQLPDVSRVRIQQLIEQKKILVNNSLPKPSFRLHGGEQIEITGRVALPPLKAFAEDIPLNVVYEDEDIVVLNKAAGMSVHAGSGRDEAGQKGTLVNALLHRFASLSQLGGELRPGIVHRLDKDTSGLMVVAKNDRAHHKLAQQFSRRETKKTYIALVHGWTKQEKGTITTPISRDLVRRTRMTARRSQGREAVTHWRVLKRIEGPYGKFSLLEVKIETGRTHQIRVHLSSIGHPVMGDTLYGAAREIHPTERKTNKRAHWRPREMKNAEQNSKSLALGRNFLHAAAIKFRHPVTEAPLSFEQPLPSELDLFLRQIGGK
jgi:23S rRNA pseudouridine1911/1915/1917 synthase